MNAVSIDMDYIMKPVINLYNDLSNSMNPDRVWDTINKVRNIDEFAKIDEKNFLLILKTISKILSKYSENKTKIVFAENHDYILEDLTKHPNIKLINIDHHHDISYSPEQARDVDQFDYTTVANWVWYLDKYKLLSEYTWVRNENSDQYKGAEMTGRFTELIEPKDIDLNTIDNRVDLLFICKSRSWIYPKFIIYFDYVYEMICSFLGRRLEIHKESYCVGGLPRKAEVDNRIKEEPTSKPKFFC